MKQGDYENDKLDYMLYVQAELVYTKACIKRGLTEKEADERPRKWYESMNYHKKVEILTKAVNQRKRIEELSDFEELMDWLLNDRC